MSQYGAAQNTPYSGQQQDADLVNNKRYQGQAGGTNPLGHDGRGPQEESRYGAAPLSTNTGNNRNTTNISHGNDPAETIRNPAAYGFQKHEPEGFRFPGTAGAGASQQQQRHNTTPASEFATEQPGYGQPGFGAPSQGQNTSDLWPNPTAPPNARRSDDVVGQGGYGGGVPRQQQGGVMDKIKNAVGMGPTTGHGHQGAGYGQSQAAGYDQSQAGYEQQPRREGIVDKAKDDVGIGSNTGYNQGYGQGQAGYDQPRQGGVHPGSTPGYGQSQAAGYDQQPRREGIVGKAKDDVGIGSNTGYDQGYGQGQAGYDQPRQGGVHPGSTQGYGQSQAAGYDQQPRREGIVDKAKDDVGIGSNTGYNQGYGQGQAGYDQPRQGGVHPGSTQGYGQSQAAGYDQQPRREGIVDKAKDSVGTRRAYDSTPGGTHTGTGEFNPNVNHHNEERGFGGGLGYDQSEELGDGYHTGMATGADAYGQHQPRREGVVDNARDAAGGGPNSGYGARTPTGNDAYVHGNHPPGMQDRIQGVNEPTVLGGDHGVHAGVGRHDGVLGKGEHVPESLLGERRTESGYDASKGHTSSRLPGHEGDRQKLSGTGQGSDTTNVDYDERRGKGHEDSKIGTGTDTSDGSNKIGEGIGSHGATRAGTETAYDGTGVNHGSGAAPPKKGLITKIKDKLHH